MKSCPTCNRTFEDSFTFCLVDGSILSAPFDPQATQRISNARSTDPPPTEVLPSNSISDNAALPPTVVEPSVTYKLPTTSPSVVYHAEQKSKKPSKIRQTFWSAVAGMVVGLIIGGFKKNGYQYRGVIEIDSIAEAAFTGIFFGIVGLIVGYIIWAFIKYMRKD